jgi:hypothetical protein
MTRQTLRTRPACSGGLNSRAANLLDRPEVSLVCPNIFTMGVRVEQAARAFCTLQRSGSSGDWVLHEEAVCGTE